MKKNLMSVALVAAVCLSGPLAADEVHLLPQPCRIMDSRIWLGPIGSGHTLPFALNPGAAETQGGVAGCSIPATATAARLLVHGAPVVADGGYLRVYNAGIDPDQIFASVTLQDPGQYTTVTVDVPVVQSTPAQVVAIWAQVQAQTVVDLAGWLEPCIPEETFGLAYSETLSSISVPETGDIDLLKYGGGGSIWVGGAASQPRRYTITGSGVSGGRQRLYVTPVPQSATDQGLEVHVLPGSCSPREVALDGPGG